jgi:hypothetical protein
MMMMIIIIIIIIMLVEGIVKHERGMAVKTMLKRRDKFVTYLNLKWTTAKVTASKYHPANDLKCT